MKKVLAVILAICCCFTLISCGNDEAAAKKVADNFLTAFVNLDFEEAAKYMDNPESAQELAGALDFSSIFGAEDLGGFEDEMQEFLDNMLEKMKGYCSYEIKSVEKNGNDYDVTVDVTFPDVDNVDFEDYFADKLDPTNLMSLLTPYFENGTLSLTSSEDEVLAVMMPEMFKLLNDTINEMDFEKTTENQVLVVSKYDGEWLINTEKSDIN